MSAEDGQSKLIIKGHKTRNPKNLAQLMGKPSAASTIGYHNGPTMPYFQDIWNTALETH
jgi:hypothetical protein